MRARAPGLSATLTSGNRVREIDVRAVVRAIIPASLNTALTPDAGVCEGFSEPP
jgi:hypothetical protein